MEVHLFDTDAGIGNGTFHGHVSTGNDARTTQVCAVRDTAHFEQIFDQAMDCLQWLNLCLGFTWGLRNTHFHYNFWTNAMFMQVYTGITLYGFVYMFNPETANHAGYMERGASCLLVSALSLFTGISISTCVVHYIFHPQFIQLESESSAGSGSCSLSACSTGTGTGLELLSWDDVTDVMGAYSEDAVCDTSISVDSELALPCFAVDEFPESSLSINSNNVDIVLSDAFAFNPGYSDFALTDTREDLNGTCESNSSHEGSYASAISSDDISTEPPKKQQRHTLNCLPRSLESIATVELPHKLAHRDVIFVSQGKSTPELPKVKDPGLFMAQPMESVALVDHAGNIVMANPDFMFLATQIGNGRQYDGMPKLGSMIARLILLSQWKLMHEKEAEVGFDEISDHKDFRIWGTLVHSGEHIMCKIEKYLIMVTPSSVPTSTVRAVPSVHLQAETLLDDLELQAMIESNTAAPTCTWNTYKNTHRIYKYQTTKNGAWTPY